MDNPRVFHGQYDMQTCFFLRETTQERTRLGAQPSKPGAVLETPIHKGGVGIAVSPEKKKNYCWHWKQLNWS